MRFLNYIKGKFHEAILKFWSEEEKVALMKIIHDIYVSDNEFSDEEKNDYGQMLKKLNINGVDVDNIEIDNAVAVLEKERFKEELIYIVMAEAIFKDEDYDEIESSYINNFVKKYAISAEILTKNIKKIRNEKLDKILKDWVKEIEETNIK